MKEKVCRHLLPGIEQIWEKITLEKYEGVGAKRKKKEGFDGSEIF